MPPAYFVAQVDVKDSERYETYKAGTPATIAKHGGEYVVRGGRLEALAGEPPLGRVVILKFPSYEEGLAWYRSGDYADLLAERMAISVSRDFLVEGVD